MISPAVSQTLSHSKKGRDQVDRRTARLAAAVPAGRSKIGALLLSSSLCLGGNGQHHHHGKETSLRRAGSPRVVGGCVHKYNVTCYCRLYVHCMWYMHVKNTYNEHLNGLKPPSSETRSQQSQVCVQFGDH